jgi:hypothetical protein
MACAQGGSGNLRHTTCLYGVDVVAALLGQPLLRETNYHLLSLESLACAIRQWLAKLIFASMCLVWAWRLPVSTLALCKKHTVWLC